MRSSPSMLLAALGGAAGCSDVCPTPQESLEGARFRAFHAPMAYTSDNLDGLTAAPDFLSYELLANGPTSWEIEWEATTAIGAVVARLDGVEFAGTGEWNTVECGNFTLNTMAADRYVDALGTSHTARFGAELVRFEDRLEGMMVWQEAWTAADGEVGDFRAEVAVLAADEP